MKIPARRKQSAGSATMKTTSMRRDPKKVYAENRLMRRQFKKIVDALRFYAEPETYFAIGFIPDRPCGDFVRDFSETEDLGMKPGKRARRAIDKLVADWNRSFPDAAVEVST